MSSPAQVFTTELLSATSASSLHPSSTDSSLSGAPDDDEYYHGFMTDEEAAELVAIEGDWLLRCKYMNGLPEFVLTYSAECDVHSVLINVTYQGMWSFNRVRFATVQDLVAHFVERLDRVPGNTDGMLLRVVPRPTCSIIDTDAVVEVIKDDKGVWPKNGRFGEMNLVTVRNALCVQKKCAVGKTVSLKERFMRGMHLWRRLGHDNCVAFIAMDVLNEPLTVYVEHCALGGLDKFLAEIPSENRPPLCAQLCSAVTHLHTCRIVHARITPEHVLVAYANDGNLTIKLSGISCCVPGPVYRLPLPVIAETHPWRHWSSELLESREHALNETSDAWALAVTVWMMLSSGVPHAEYDTFHDLLKSERTSDMQWDMTEVPDNIAEVLKQMWNRDESARASIDKLEKACNEIVEEDGDEDEDDEDSTESEE